MAAVIDFHTATAVHQPSPHAEPRAQRPKLTVIEGGRSASVRTMRRTYLLRRLAVAAGLVVVLVLLVQVGQALVGSAGSVTAERATSVHQVQRGDTLWAIAAAADPQADPRDVVDRIVELNGGRVAFSPDEPLRIGQELVVPAAAG